MIRENTVVVSVRMDARDLAVLIRWWRRQMGDQPTSTSALVKESLGVLVDMGVKQWPELAVESQQEAFDEIEQSRLNVRSNRSRRAMGRGLQREQATFRAGSSAYDQEPLPDTHMGVDMVAARALLKEKQNQPLKHDWGEALEADQPGFQERYQAREQNKLSELKAGLAGGPAAVGSDERKE